MNLHIFKIKKSRRYLDSLMFLIKWIAQKIGFFSAFNKHEQPPEEQYRLWRRYAWLESFFAITDNR